MSWLQIIQPPVGSRGSPGSDDPISALAVSNKAALECLLTAQISHPNIVATYKSAQVPYKVREPTSLSLLCLLLCIHDFQSWQNPFAWGCQAMLCLKYILYILIIEHVNLISYNNNI